MRKLLIILGPTATGKTDLALYLAKKFNGEIVSCDSRQVYVGLDVGTGKMPNGQWIIDNGQLKKGQGSWEMNRVKIWMYDVVGFKKQYSVYDYVKGANLVIGEISKRGKLPIIVGGTGLYLKALLEGLPNLAIPVDQRLRRQLLKLSKEELQQKLQKFSFKRWQGMNESDRENPRRLVRAIELAISDHEIDPSLVARDDNVLKIGLTAKRDVLYKRVDERVVSRINQGMIEEAKALHAESLALKRMRQLGLEYGVLADYLEDKIQSADIFIKTLQQKIHGYLRRQLTWFKKEKEVFWFDITNKKYPGNVEKRVSKWYYQADDTKNRHLS